MVRIVSARFAMDDGQDNRDAFGWALAVYDPNAQADSSYHLRVSEVRKARNKRRREARRKQRRSSVN